ncbi:MAG TPA: hypothetical protein VMC43_00160 [Candidatus Paceibacterota bacterium]|nr:hypothetical protein [Candidatus Paceibacterota bacterium]
MSPKAITMLGMVVGSTLGGLLPMLWGADAFSLSAVFFTAIGGILGTWLGFRISH